MQTPGKSVMSQWGLCLEIHKLFSKFGKCKTNLTLDLNDLVVEVLQTIKC